MRTSVFLLSLSAFAASIAPVAAQQDAPASAWVYVGRVAEDGRFTAGPAIDAKATAVNSGKVARVQLAHDAALSTNDECSQVKPEDLRAPTDEDLRKQHPLLKADPRTPLNVQATSECRSAGKGRLLYAKVAVQPDRVRYATLAELTKR